MSSKSLQTAKAELEQHLKTILNKMLPAHSFAQVYHYAVFPPGKLIRPLLAKATWCDLTRRPLDTAWSIDFPHTLFAAAIEMHHAYTLIHDDLPCMDNDKERRGKATTHIAFGEWQALLAGDGLLNASYGALSKIDSPAIAPTDYKQLLRFFSWCLGPKGLIQGQVLDLSDKHHPPLAELIDIHKLKTSRLMQAAIVGSYLLLPKSDLHPHFKDSHRKHLFMDLFKLSHHLGIMFQLFDDLDDLATQANGQHEHEINPFYFYPKESLEKLNNSTQHLLSMLQRHQMNNLEIVLKGLFDKTQQNLLTNQAIIEKKLNQKGILGPVMSFLNRHRHSN